MFLFKLLTGGKMSLSKIYRLGILIVVSSILLSNCSEDNIVIPGLQDHTVKGYAQKGPFIQGSQITIQVLDNSLNPIGKVFETETINNLGYYESPSVITNNFVEIISNGFFFNEVSGNVSNAQLTLRAVSSVSYSDTVNVNVLTSLTAKRIRYLLTNKKMQFDDAKKTAEQEVLKIFNINDPTIANFERMDITKNGKNNAALLAASCVLQGNASVAQLSEFISKISTEMETDGLQNDSTITERLSYNSYNLNNQNIRSNIFNRYQILGLNLPIPDFEAYTKLLVPLTISYTNPYDQSNNVSVSTKISVGFNKSMIPTSFNANSFIVSKGLTNIMGIISYNQNYNAAEFTPTNKFTYGTEYSVKLTGEISAYDGEHLDSTYQFSFTTLQIPRPNLNYPSNNQLIPETSPVFDWNDIDGAISYVLQVSTSSDFSSNIFIDVADVISSQFQISSPLENNLVYFWRVKVKTTGDVWSDWSSTGNFTVKLTTVRYPNPSSYSYITDTTPLLDWEDVNSTVLYYLQVNDASDFSGNMIIDLNTLIESKYQINNGLTDYTSYYWRVKRKNNDGVWSDWSLNWNFIIMMNIPSLNLPSNGSTTIERKPLLNWTNVPSAIHYHLQLSTTEEFTSNNIVEDASLTSNQFQVNIELPYNQRYFWRVRVQNIDGVWSRWTTTYSFTIPRLDIQTDLLFYYPFNGNTLDESGNYNNATANGLSLTSDRFGNVNSAYKFDADGDYLEMPPVREISSSEWTYSMWVKFDVVPSPQVVNDAFLFTYKGVLFDDDVYLYIDDVDANVKAYLGTIGQSGVSGNIVNRKISNNYLVEQNLWYHLCVTHDPDPAKIIIYINGEFYASSPEKFGTTFLPNTPYLISCITNFGNQKGRFIGSADEVHFFGKVLNFAEVRMLYNKVGK